MIYVTVAIGFLIGLIVWFGAGLPTVGGVICCLSLAFPWLTLLIEPLRALAEFLVKLFRAIFKR